MKKLLINSFLIMAVIFVNIIPAKADVVVPTGFRARPNSCIRLSFEKIGGDCYTFFGSKLTLASYIFVVTLVILVIYSLIFLYIVRKRKNRK